MPRLLRRPPTTGFEGEQRVIGRHWHSRCDRRNGQRWRSLAHISRRTAAERRGDANAGRSRFGPHTVSPASLDHRDYHGWFLAAGAESGGRRRHASTDGGGRYRWSVHGNVGGPVFHAVPLRHLHEEDMKALCPSSELRTPPSGRHTNVFRTSYCTPRHNRRSGGSPTATANLHH